ncbi:MAG: hypothetical protein LBS61_02300 [Endomicrobium sp.]|jgi:hypothetical protein|nr:hypothetical protein [Endomicrobium sp.]
MNEEKQQHLEFIQNVITRMNTNSFQIKKLAILLITALLAVYTSKIIMTFLLVPIIPTLILWGLDSYYLQQERKFRGVYNDISGLKNLNEVKPYEMPIHKYTSDKNKSFGFFNVLFSKTLICFYLPILVLPLTLYFIVK